VDRARVLIVDDLPEKVLVYRAVLEELDAELVVAHSGTEALKQILHDDFAVILLDVHMPDIDGLETATLIRRYRRSSQTPIIFVTAYADELETSRAYELGAYVNIPCPFLQA
jgi:CheY-like chemotaxis protein